MAHRWVMLVGLVALGCWGSSDENDEPPPAAAGAAGVAGAPGSAQATECQSLDDVKACYSCNGDLVPGSLVELDGNKLWNPPGNSRWRLLSVDGGLSTWCSE